VLSLVTGTDPENEWPLILENAANAFRPQTYRRDDDICIVGFRQRGVEQHEVIHRFLKDDRELFLEMLLNRDHNQKIESAG